MKNSMPNTQYSILNTRYPILLPVLYMVLIFALSSVPADNNRLAGVLFIPPTLQNLLHIPIYAVLSFLWMRAFANKGLRLKKAIFYTLLIGIPYSIFDEFHQSFVPGRFMSLTDVVFNTVGCVAGAMFYIKIILTGKTKVIKHGF